MNRTHEIFGIQPCLKDWNLINISSEIRADPWEKSQKLINVHGMFIPDSRVESDFFYIHVNKTQVTLVSSVARDFMAKGKH